MNYKLPDYLQQEQTMAKTITENKILRAERIALGTRVVSKVNNPTVGCRYGCRDRCASGGNAHHSTCNFNDRIPDPHTAIY